MKSNSFTLLRATLVYAAMAAITVPLCKTFQKKLPVVFDGILED